LWAGARATWGVKGGRWVSVWDGRRQGSWSDHSHLWWHRYGFECTVEENVEVDLPEKEENPHVCRWVEPVPMMCMCLHVVVCDDAHAYY